MKLVVTEQDSMAMRTWFGRNGPCWSSQLLCTEALRAAERLGLHAQVVRTVLDTVSLVLPVASTFVAAGGLKPSTLRSLDALHLATALEIGVDLAGLVTYDARMIDGAKAASIAVHTPV